MRRFISRVIFFSGGISSCVLVFELRNDEKKVTAILAGLFIFPHFKSENDSNEAIIALKNVTNVTKLQILWRNKARVYDC